MCSKLESDARARRYIKGEKSMRRKINSRKINSRKISLRKISLRKTNLRKISLKRINSGNTNYSNNRKSLLAIYAARVLFSLLFSLLFSFFLACLLPFYRADVSATELSGTISYPGSEIDYGYTFYDGFWYRSYEDYNKETLYHESSSCYYIGSHAYGDEESQNYEWRNHAQPVRSYLVPVSGKSGEYMTVQFISDQNEAYNASDATTSSGKQKIGIEYYSEDPKTEMLKFRKSKVITPELPLFGAFYEMDGYYYLLTGQENPSESDNREVLRLTKYDTNWKKVGSCSLYGANTYVPFEAGSARICADVSKAGSDTKHFLLIRTCHLMYASGGAHHQANLTLQVDADAMKITDSFTDVHLVAKGYVSHSFNQFVQVEDHKLVAVDHGDAYPRSVVLINYTKDLTDGTFLTTKAKPGYSKCSSTNLITFPGQIGDNATGVALGGFEISSKAYLVAGNRSSDIYTSDGTRNVFLAVKDKLTGKVSVKTFSNNTGKTASNPHLVRLAADSFLLMWSLDNVVHYVKLDAYGNKVGKEYTMPGNLSECKPVVSDGKLTWYVRNYLGLKFYRILISNLSKTQMICIPKYSDEWITCRGTVYYIRPDGTVDGDLTLRWKNVTDSYGVTGKNRAILNVSGDNKKENNYKTSSWVISHPGRYAGYEETNYGVKQKTYGPVSCWLKIDGAWYYVRKDGTMASGEWIKGYWMSKSGKWTYKERGNWKRITERVTGSSTKKSGGAQSSGSADNIKYTVRWRYEDTSGWYAKGWYQIDENWYCFTGDGYMKTGWVKDRRTGNWYYLGNNGVMRHEQWVKYNGSWYYFREDGTMVTGTMEINGVTYHFSELGKMI